MKRREEKRDQLRSSTLDLGLKDQRNTFEGSSIHADLLYSTGVGDGELWDAREQASDAADAFERGRERTEVSSSSTRLSKTRAIEETNQITSAPSFWYSGKWKESERTEARSNFSSS